VQIPTLVVFDVDGTLVDWDGNVSTSTASTLAKLREMRVPIALATGRPLSIAQLTLDHVGGADWMACGNGSVLFDVASGIRLRDRYLPDHIVEPLVRSLRRELPGVGFAIELSDTMIEEEGFARRVPEEPTVAPVADVLVALHDAQSPVRRLIPFHDDFDQRLDELAAIVGRFVDGRCQVQFGGLPIIDVSPVGDHKAAAMQVLIEHLGIEVSDVVAFGDGSNDIEMLHWAGIGVAMGNAGPLVQSVADVVTASIDGLGIADYFAALFASD